MAGTPVTGNISYSPPTFTVAGNYTVAPTSYAGPGTNLAYNYTIRNTSGAGAPAFNFTGLSGARITNSPSNVSCSAALPALILPGAQVTCTSFYTTSATDTATFSVAPTVDGINAMTSANASFTLAPTTITYIPPAPGLSLTATPNPTTFSAAGQAIGYSFAVRNTGGVPLAALALTGTRIGAPVACAATTLAVGASTTCTSTYTTAGTDVGANIPYSVTATASPQTQNIVPVPPVTATVSGSITFVQPTVTLGQPIPNVTTFTRVGEVITFTYPFTTGSVSVPNVCIVDTTVPNIVCPPGPFAPTTQFVCTGTYTTTAADVSKGSITTNAGIAIRPTATGSCNATPTVQSRTPVVLNSAQVAQNAARGINNFLVRRAEVTAGAQPDTSRQHARLTGCVFGSCGDEEASGPAAGFNGGSGNRASLGSGSAIQDLSSQGLEGLGLGGVPDDDLRRPSLFGKSEADGEQATGPANPGRSSKALGALGFSGQSGDGNSRFGFSTSLDQIRRETEKSRADVLGYRDTGGGDTYRRRPATFDIWAQGNWAAYEDKRGGTKITGDGGSLMFGADYRVTPAILIGIMGSIDQINDQAKTQVGAADGKGWMFGPYASVRLSRNVFLDIRGAWGGSDNAVDATGGGVRDGFSTDRSLYSAKLTGNYAWGGFRIRPSAELLHYEEKQKAFLSQVGVLIPGQTVTLGRLTFGPEVSYKVVRHDGSTFEPFFGLKGIWDFDKTKSVNLIDGSPAGSQELRGLVEGGVSFRSLRGVAVRVSASYDGIGDDSFHAIREQVTVTVPLN